VQLNKTNNNYDYYYKNYYNYIHTINPADTVVRDKTIKSSQKFCTNSTTKTNKL